MGLDPDGRERAARRMRSLLLKGRQQLLKSHLNHRFASSQLVEQFREEGMMPHL